MELWQQHALSQLATDSTASSGCPLPQRLPQRCEKKRDQRSFRRLGSQGLSLADPSYHPTHRGANEPQEVEDQHSALSLRRPDGEICTLLTEALEVWISFFKDMEGVERITAAQQRKLWCSSLADLQQTSLGLNAQDLP